MSAKVTEVRGIRIGEGIPKICVPITGRTADEIENGAAEISAYPEADLVEWRLDWFDGLQDPEAVKAAALRIRNRIGERPLLVTIRTKSEGGEAELSPEDYHAVNRMLAEAKLADLVDVETFFCPERLGAWIKELKGLGARVIGSWHSFSETPEEEAMVSRMRKIQATGVDVVKLAVMPERKEDVKRLMRAARVMKERYSDRPLITMSMSGLGVASRIALEKYGAAVTFGTAGAASAPGQLPVRELKEILQAVHEGRKIVLTGFMGSGKTTVGTTLAEGLRCPLYDTDQLIEEREGMAISSLFEKKGEDYFRRRETELLAELKHRKGMAVISTGGGLPMRKENHALLAKLGVVIFLRVKKETVLARLAGDRTRPLLAGSDPAAKVEELLRVRTPVYESAADLILAAD